MNECQCNAKHPEKDKYTMHCHLEGKFEIRKAQPGGAYQDYSLVANDLEYNNARVITGELNRLDRRAADFKTVAYANKRDAENYRDHALNLEHQIKLYNLHLGRTSATQATVLEYERSLREKDKLHVEMARRYDRIKVLEQEVANLTANLDLLRNDRDAGWNKYWGLKEEIQKALNVYPYRHVGFQGPGEKNI